MLSTRTLNITTTGGHKSPLVLGLNRTVGLNKFLVGGLIVEEDSSIEDAIFIT